MRDNTASIITECPLGPIDVVARESAAFYSRKERDLHKDSSAALLSLRSAFRPLGEGGETSFELEGERWVRLEAPSVNWSLAPDDVYFGVNPDTARRHSPRHVHATFNAIGHSFHLDFVRFMSWGPLSGTEEFLVYVDNEFRTRGGLYVHVPAACPRNWPIFVRVGAYALVISDMFLLQTKGLNFDGLSLWALDTNRTG